MAKDPAFLFYSSDFLTGVTDLNMEERGQYITLLCLQHQKGHLSDKTIRLNVGSPSVDLMAKFSIDEQGLFFNAVLEQKIEERRQFIESRRVNGSLGGRPKANDKPNAKASGKPLGYPTDNLGEDENEDESNLPGEESPREEPKHIIDYLNQHCGKKFQQVESNLKFIRARLNDGVTPADLMYVIENKSREWKGTQMDKYLRPETLFNATKFQSYVNEPKYHGAENDKPVSPSNYSTNPNTIIDEMRAERGIKRAYA